MILVVGAGKSAAIAAEEIICQGEEVLRLLLPEENAAELPTVTTVHGRLQKFSGVQGNFTAQIATTAGLQNFAVGAAILAIDETPITAANVLTLSSILEIKSLSWASTIVILLDAQKPDRASHIVAVEKARALKKANPACKIYIITPEVRTFGLDELAYCKAQQEGIIFIRAENIEQSAHSLSVTDSPSGKTLEITPDLIITDEEQEVRNAAFWAKAFAINLYEDGHFRLGNVSRGPLTSMRPGVFLCGTASRALLPREMDTSARAAATRAVTASRLPLTINAASVQEEQCAACLTCVRNCLFHAPAINERGKSEIAQDLCQACGLCVNLCPAAAITLPGSGRTDLNEVLAQVLRCRHE